MSNRRRARSRAGDGVMTTFCDLLLSTLLVILLVLFVYIQQVPEVQATVQQATETMEQANTTMQQASATLQQAKESQLAADTKKGELDQRSKDLDKFQESLNEGLKQQRVDREARARAVAARNKAEKDRQRAVEDKKKAIAVARKARSEAEKARALTARSQKDAKAARQQSSLDRAVLKSVVETVGVDLVFVIDLSQSWKSTQPRILETVRLISEVLPDMSAEVRIGLIGFREAVVHQQSLTQVLPNSIDGGRSQRQIARIVAGMQGKSARVDIERAIDHGMHYLQDRSTDGRMQLLVVIGDVGMEERNGDEVLDVDEQADAKRLFARVKAWTGDHSHRRILTLFVGDEADTLGQKFFTLLAQSAGTRGRYSDNHSHLVIEAVRSAIPKNTPPNTK